MNLKHKLSNKEIEKLTLLNYKIHKAELRILKFYKEYFEKKGLKCNLTKLSYI